MDTISKLNRFIEAEQLTIDEVLAEDDGPEPEVTGPQPGDLVTHADYPDFRGRIKTVNNGQCKVEVLDGWKGPMPKRPVPIPSAKLEVCHERD